MAHEHHSGNQLRHAEFYPRQGWNQPLLAPDTVMINNVSMWLYSIWEPCQNKFGKQLHEKISWHCHAIVWKWISCKYVKKYMTRMRYYANALTVIWGLVGISCIQNIDWAYQIEKKEIVQAFGWICVDNNGVVIVTSFYLRGDLIKYTK